MTNSFPLELAVQVEEAVLAVQVAVLAAEQVEGHVTEQGLADLPLPCL